MRNLFALSIAAGLVLGASPARAHPHVWIEAKVEVLYDSENRVTAVRHSWIFDEMFSAIGVLGLDADRNGKYSREELAPFAKINVESLHEFKFFTFLTQAGKAVEFANPNEHWLDYDASRLTLNYTLPLKQPLPHASGAIELEVYDPEYFIAFSLAQTEPARVSGARPTCAVAVKSAGPLDTGTAMSLSELTPDVRELPDEFASIRGDISNRITITCR